MVSFILLYAIFLGYLILIIVMTDAFLTSYQPTANLYKNVADMVVAVCGVYALRETLYYEAFFFFYNSLCVDPIPSLLMHRTFNYLK